MTSSGAGGAGSYARALEGALSRLRERPVVLSPRDWELVSDWYARGVPLAVVLEALEAAAERAARRKGSAGPRSLAYVAPAVEETWASIVEGRAVAAGGPSLPSAEGVVAAWRAAAREAGPGSALAGVLESLLSRLDEGASTGDLDAELDRRLPEAAPAERVASMRREVEAELEPFRARMSGERLRATRDRALAGRLRRALGLPRLSLTGPVERNRPG